MRILAFAPDVFFAAKLQAMAGRAGAEIASVKSAAEAEARAAAGESFDVLVCDLETGAAGAEETRAGMVRLWPGAQRWAFAAHGSAERMEKARADGWNAMSRGMFEAKFPGALR